MRVVAIVILIATGIAGCGAPGPDGEFDKAPEFKTPEVQSPEVREPEVSWPRTGTPDPEEHAACRAMHRIMVNSESGWECREVAKSEEVCLERVEEGVAEAYYFAGEYRACFEDVIDGGAPCSGTSECDGYCEAPPDAEMGDEVEGTCSHRTLEKCLQSVSDGYANPWACV